MAAKQTIVQYPICRIFLVVLLMWIQPSSAFVGPTLSAGVLRKSPAGTVSYSTKGGQPTYPRQSSMESPSLSLLHMSSSPEGEKQKLPFLLDPGTKGGALFYMSALFAIPYALYQVLVASGRDEVETGILIGAAFTILSTLAWSSTYLFRVATKDMTYAKQLKDYENAVIAKRLEELDEDEVQALVEEVEKDKF